MNLSSSRPDIAFNAPIALSATGAASTATQAPTACERVLAAELGARGEAHDALSMMVSSMVRMVQAGKTRQSRWKDS
ncbi:MAG: hypothetical protein AAFX65_11040 [Cyanobacteria bacterium J06638_7]